MIFRYSVYNLFRIFGAKTLFITTSFSNHAEKQRYGLAQTFNLVDTFKNSIPKFDKVDEEKLITKIIYKEPKVTKGLPCIGIVDVTELYYKDRKIPIKDGYEVVEVKEVKKENKEKEVKEAKAEINKDISWQISYVLDYKKPFSEENNAKSCFLISAEGNGGEGETHYETL